MKLYRNVGNQKSYGQKIVLFLAVVMAVGQLFGSVIALAADRTITVSIKFQQIVVSTGMAGAGGEPHTTLVPFVASKVSGLSPAINGGDPKPNADGTISFVGQPGTAYSFTASDAQGSFVGISVGADGKTLTTSNPTISAGDEPHTPGISYVGIQSSMTDSSNPGTTVNSTNSVGNNTPVSQLPASNTTVTTGNTPLALDGNSSVLPDNLNGISAPSSSKINSQFLDLQTGLPVFYNLAIIAAIIIFVVLIFIGGIRYLTSAGGDGTEQAKKLMLSATVGLALVLGTWAILLFVFSLTGYSSGTPFSSLGEVIHTLFFIITVAAVILFVVLLLVGAIQYLASFGNEDGTTKAKKLMLDAVVGLFIVLAAAGIASFVFAMFHIPVVPGL